MKLWLDDKREKPADFDAWAKTASEAISLIDKGDVTHISLDHDLGDVAGQRELTGYDVAVHIEEGAANGTIAPMTWAIHSDNPAGRARMEMAMKSADKFWARQQKSAWLVKADPNKRVIIMRGLPGSGKSTKAKTYGGTIVSADDYFMQDGVYKFDPQKLGQAHSTTKRLFEEALRRGDPVVVVDNTNTTQREFQDYVDLAGNYGYTVEFDVVGTGGASVEELVDRNTHGVPEESIRRMVNRWYGDPLYPESHRDNPWVLRAKLKKAIPAEVLARKWKVDIAVIEKALDKGQKVEREHTGSDAEARQIASHHINEMLDYYDKLETIEKPKN